MPAVPGILVDHHPLAKDISLWQEGQQPSEAVAYRAIVRKEVEIIAGQITNVSTIRVRPDTPLNEGSRVEIGGEILIARQVEVLPDSNVILAILQDE